VQELPVEQILRLTSSPVRNYVGLDMSALAKEFEAMPTRGAITAADRNVASALEIKDSMAPLTMREQASAVAALPTEKKLSHVAKLIGRPLADEDREALLQAIFFRSIPKTRAQLKAGEEPPFEREDILQKMKILNAGKFSAGERRTIMESGALGVFKPEP
jgi:hypothetical protein